MIARFVGYGFALFLPLVLARVLTIGDFGVYKQAFLIVTTMSAILPLNFSLSAFYFLPRDRKSRPAVVLNVLMAHSVTGIIGASLVALSPGFLTLLLGDTALIHSSRILGGVVFLWTFSGLAESIATANQDVRYSTWLIIGAQLSKTILLLSSAVFFRTVDSLLWAAIVQGLIQSGILLWYTSSAFDRWWKSFDAQLLREQIKYVLPFGFAAILWKLQMDLHGFLVANKFSDADFAIYAVGISQLPLIALFRESINSVLLARMSSLQQANERKEMIRLFFTAMRKLGIVYLPVVAMLLVLGHELLILMYTRAYENSWPIFAINLLTLLTSIVSVDAILRAHADWRFFLVKLRIALIVFLIVASLAAIGRFGMIGAVEVLVFTLVVERLVLAVAVTKMLDMRWSDWKLAAPVLHLGAISLIAAIVTVAVRAMTLAYGPLMTVLLGGLVFVAVYVGLIVAAGLLDAAERATIQRLAAKITGRRSAVAVN